MAKSWNRRQVLGISVIGLLSIIGIVYISRSATEASAVKSRVTKPAAAHASAVEVTINELRERADKQAEPLLVQLRKSPDDPLLLAEVGKIYYQMRQFSVAAKYYNDSVRVKPDAAVLVKLGGAFHLDGEDEKAIEAWNHALRLDPGNADALFNIGFVKWHSQGDSKAAIAAWQKLLERNPDHPKRAQVEQLLAQAKQQ